MRNKRTSIDTLSSDDPNHDVAKRFNLKIEADALGFEADVHAGKATLQDVVDANFATFAEAANAQVAFIGDPNDTCREIDTMAHKFIRHASGALTKESKRFGTKAVRAANHDFSARVKECAARAKKRILESELRKMGPERGDSQPADVRKSVVLENPAFPLKTYVLEHLEKALKRRRANFSARIAPLGLLQWAEEQTLNTADLHALYETRAKKRDAIVIEDFYSVLTEYSLAYLPAYRSLGSLVVIIPWLYRELAEQTLFEKWPRGSGTREADRSRFLESVKDPRNQPVEWLKVVEELQQVAGKEGQSFDIHALAFPPHASTDKDSESPSGEIPDSLLAPPAGDSKTGQKTSGGSSRRTSASKNRRSGRRADETLNRAIAEVIGRFGENWPSRVIEICEALDEESLALPMSRKRKQKGCSSWTDVAAEDREGLRKALQHRLDWCLKHPIDVI
jgi:hypothetical protein